MERGASKIRLKIIIVRHYFNPYFINSDLMSLIRRFDDCVRTCEIPFTKRDDMRDGIMVSDDIPEPWSRQWSWRKGSNSS